MKRIDRDEQIRQYLDLIRKIRLSAEFKTLTRQCQIEGTLIARKLNESPSGNVSYSTISLMYALGMALEGANPQLRDKALGNLCEGSIRWDRIASDFRDALDLIQANPNAKCLIANLAAINTGHAVMTEGQDYESRLKDTFDAAVEELDFGSKDAASFLSDWICEKTEGKLKPRIELSPLALLALVNTLYLKASWKTEFDEGDTKPRMFHGPEGDFEARFMCGTIYNVPVYFGWFHERIEFPLEGGFTCKLIKPRHGQTLDTLFYDSKYLERALHEGIREYFDVHVELPRFEIRSSLDITSILSQLGFDFLFAIDGNGMRNLFDTPVCVNSAKQETYLKVNEEGLEGAAYTIMAIVAGHHEHIEQEKRDIVFDEPFIFSIEDDSGIPFFTGVVNEPERV